MNYCISITDAVEPQELIELYCSVEWSAAEKPDLLTSALNNSHTLVTARDDGKLIGVGNAISDGSLVVYYPHLLVHKDYQNHGVGKAILKEMMAPYQGFHQQMITADIKAVSFYESLGFSLADGTCSMWIYDGDDH